MSEKSQNDAFLKANENFDMLKAMYDFQAVYPKTISFDEGEFFIMHQTSAKQRNWWQVINIKGNIGFVPSNYVSRLQVEPKFLHGFLDSSIESLKLSSETEINGIISREDLIQRLIERKAEIEEMIKTGDANDTDQEWSISESMKTDEKEPVKIGNGHLPHDETAECNDMAFEELPASKADKLDSSKKSLSTSSVLNTAPPSQFIPESPSMGTLETTKVKVEEEVTTPDGNQVSNFSEELSDATNTTTTATLTTTTTASSDEITTISKVEKEDKVEKHVENNNSQLLDEVSEEISQKQSDMPKIEAQDVYQIVDAVRKSTNLSHELSCVALRVVLSELEALSPPLLPHLEPIAVHLTNNNICIPENLLGQTYDAQRLRFLFSELTDCKNDSEQRTWMLHEDEYEIKRYLNELIKILADADPKICRFEMSCEHYQCIVNLILYYQMETRWSIRKLLLSVFKEMCHLDCKAVDIILGSVLPLELTNDMISNPRNVEKLSKLAEILTILFCVGLKMPTNNHEHLRSDFIIFLLNIVENPPDTDVNEMLPDTMINLILAFNFQFDNFTSNAVLEATLGIAKKDNCSLKTVKTFTEKILMLVNREEDPVHLLKHTPPPANSVLKILVDLYSFRETAALFYSNDNKVLIDILVRQLSDLSANEPIRKWYLELCRRILRNTNYSEHQHRRQDLMKIFTRIFCEETECSAGDQQIVREISNEFPQIFKS